MLREAKPGVLNPVAAYDSFAPYYRSYTATRSDYLKAVENIIIGQSLGSNTLLDVGSGDGHRALTIARQIGVKNVLLVEPSAAMRALCSEKVEFLGYRATEIPQTNSTFDVITCLWNVLGHIRSTEERTQVLARLKLRLASGGALFLDVNHRYNAAAYGWTKTLLRMLYDFPSRSGSHGDVVVSWQAGDRQIITHGHVFTSGELARIFCDAGLKVKCRWTIDYESGRERQSRFLGNLLYRLEPAT